MSGIAGIINKAAHVSAQICDNIQEKLKCRGSDIYGTYISEKMCLIHTGYSHEDSRQPLRGVVGQKAYVMVFDGEVYNKNELRQELGTLGYRFQENTDAAVVLQAYMAWGQSCVERINGVFAFAVWDETGLFLARDRLGVRPLYYSVGSYGLVFASNIKAVLAHPEVDPVISPDGIAELIMLGPGRSPGHAVFKNIKELAPGECAYYKEELAKSTYWRLKAKIHQDNFAQTVETVRGLLTDAIRRQSGGQVAALLSGGLDSSVITAVSGVRDTFSIDYVGNDKHFSPTEYQPDDDNEFIAQMVSARSLNHRRTILGSDELADALHDAMEARGLSGMADIDSALLLLLRKVGENFNTALSGEGADEIFGGYPWFQDEARLFAGTFPWAQNAEYRASFLRPGLINSPTDYVKSHFDRAILAANTLYDDDKTEKRVRQMFNLNLGWFMQTLLCRSDSMAAAAKVNIRMPFLDYRLVEYMYNVPWHFKNHDGREKGLLREAFKSYLPEKIIARKKSPFPKTHNPGYTMRMQDMLKEVLIDPDAPLLQILSKTALKKLLTTPDAANWYGQLMTYPQTIAYFLQINMWMKTFDVKIENFL